MCMEDLAQKVCVACEGGTAPLSREEAVVLMRQLKEWELSDDAKRLTKHFTFKDFKGAFAFVSAVSEIAEREGHHPDIAFGWGSADISLTTHAIGGLSENDFIVAAKIDRLE